MLETYSAVLENDHLHWTNEAPELQSQGHPVTVLVTILDEVSVNDLAGKKEKLLQVMTRIAKRSGLAAITDPIAWQQEIRADRELPGRD